MRRTGILGILILGLVALVAGFVGYQAGLTSSAAAAGATVIVTGGFPGLGLLFFLLFAGFLFFAFAGRRRGPWAVHGRGPWVPGHGPDPWAGRTGADGSEGSDPRRQWIADLHRTLHDEARGAVPPVEDASAG
jgi:hypothetical protein